MVFAHESVRPGSWGCLVQLRGLGRSHSAVVSCGGGGWGQCHPLPRTVPPGRLGLLHSRGGSPRTAGVRGLLMSSLGTGPSAGASDGDGVGHTGAAGTPSPTSRPVSGAETWATSALDPPMKGHPSPVRRPRAGYGSTAGMCMNSAPSTLLAAGTAPSACW